MRLGGIGAAGRERRKGQSGDRAHRGGGVQRMSGHAVDHSKRYRATPLHEGVGRRAREHRRRAGKIACRYHRVMEPWYGCAYNRGKSEQRSRMHGSAV